MNIKEIIKYNIYIVKLLYKNCWNVGKWLYFNVQIFVIKFRKINIRNCVI